MQRQRKRERKRERERKGRGRGLVMKPIFNMRFSAPSLHSPATSWDYAALEFLTIATYFMGHEYVTSNP